MSDSSEHPKSAEGAAEPKDASERGEDRDVASDALWFGVSGLVWALGISLVLHAFLALPFLVWEFSPNAQVFDAEWADQMEELRGIGHGMDQQRWAQLAEQNAPPPQPDEDEQVEPEDEPPEENLPEEPEEVEKPEVADDDEVEDAPEPEPEDTPPEPEEAVAKKVDPKPDDAKNKINAKKDEADKKETTKTFDPKKPLPGLERGGPTDIPSLKNYGPGNARVTALVRLDRVRGTLYEDGVRQLMRKVPDFRILAGHTGLDPIDDIDSFFMASARPQYIQESFLAVRHSMSESEIKGVLDRRFRDAIPWENAGPDGQGGQALMRRLVSEKSAYRDPRQVLLARPGLAVVGKDAWLTEIAQNLAADSPLREREGTSLTGGTKSDTPAPATMLDGLAQIERVAANGDTMVLMSAQGLVYMIPGLGRMRFEGMRLKVSNPASPTVNVDLKFKDAGEAKRFANSCPKLRGRLKKALGLDGFAGMAMRAVGLGDLIDKTKCRADAEYVNINVVLTAQQMRTLANFAAPMMPNPRVLRRLPPPPLPPKPAKPDAGVGARGANAGDAGIEAPKADAGEVDVEDVSGAK